VSWAQAIAEKARLLAPRGPLLAVATGISGALLGLAVCVASLVFDAASHGQTTDVAMLLFPHFFEHGATYLVVPALAALVYELGVDRSH
jgi:hypothetical protein